MITFVHAESGREYGEDDLALALELARRAATAIENARLYAEAERRAQAARALANVGDAVVLADAGGVVRLWNPAAAAITGIPETAAVGRRLADVVPGLARRSGSGSRSRARPGQTVTALTLPVELDGREIWLSGSGVGFAEGVVYAFRDLTEERRVEAMKSDFVATVSHELRTPLAAIHGSAQTILRPDLELDDDLKARLLDVIARGVGAARADRQRPAARVAPRLGRAAACRSRAATRSRSPGSCVEAARTHLPENVDGRAATPPTSCRRSPPTPASCARCSTTSSRTRSSTPPTAARSCSTIEGDDGAVRFRVRDEGLGIPHAEHRRVFEKFYRLDPNMTRGIGGTGLGLYICRELVRMMDGRIWVESEPGVGSTFTVEIPAAEVEAAAASPPRRKAAAARDD